MASENIVVVDTSPIIYLSAIGKAHILKELFGEIVVPEAVRNELLSGGTGSFGFDEITGEEWIKTRRIENRLAQSYLTTDLDEGEAEAIILAEELKAGLLVMDDRLARKLATHRGLTVVGTLRLLVTAKHRNIIYEVKPLIEKLKVAGFWISDEVCVELLKQANE